MPLIVQHLGRVEYSRALTLQEELLQRKLRGDTDDYLLLLEHEPVYTLGRGADVADLQEADQRLQIPAFRVGRGGGVTYHGPGQLVGYPIVTLQRRDLRRYVQALVEVLIRTCARFGVLGECRAGAPGVWVEAAKIASVGIGVRRWTTMHGVSLNVAADLSYFDAVVTCRTPQLRMTNLAAHVQKAPSMSEVEATFVDAFRTVFGNPQATGQVCAA